MPARVASVTVMLPRAILTTIRSSFPDRQADQRRAVEVGEPAALLDAVAQRRDRIGVEPDPRLQAAGRQAEAVQLAGDRDPVAGASTRTISTLAVCATTSKTRGARGRVGERNFGGELRAVRGDEERREHRHAAEGRQDDHGALQARTTGRHARDAALLRFASRDAQDVVVERVRHTECEERRPHDVRQEVPPAAMRPRPNAAPADEPPDQRHPRPRGAAAPPDPPAEPVEKSDGTVTARERRAALASERRRDVVQLLRRTRRRPAAGDDSSDP